MRVRRVGFLTLLAMFAVVHPAAAQDGEDQEVRFVSNDQPLARVQVSGFLNGVNKGIGETGGDGTFTIPADALNTVTKGTQVAVWVVTCDDGRVTQVILIREEDGDPNVHEGAHLNDRCRCDKKAVFIWGDGPVTVDVSTGQVIPTTMGGEAGAGVSGYISVFGLGQYTPKVDYSAGNTAESGWGFGGGGYGGIRLGQHLWAGIGGHIVKVSRDVVFDDESGEVDYNEYSGLVNLRYVWDKGRFNPFLEIGGGYSWQSGDNDAKHDSAVYQVGVGGTLWTSDRLGWDVKLAYRPQVESKDAGEYFGVTFGPIFNVGTPCGGQCGGRR
jgi:hypothetical protein